MKKLLTFFVVLLMTVAAWAQNPKLSYQAVVRDNSNKLVTNSHVDVTISVLRTDNSLQYTQSFAAVPTNQNGLFSLLIGGETNWDDINWLHSKIAVVITLPDLSVVKDTTEVNAVPLAINARHSATVDPSALVQSNWIQEDTEDPSFIQNKPSISDTVNGILTTGGYVTASALDGRHYLTSDSTVITTMQSDISKNADGIDNLIQHTAKAAIRDSVAGQIHDSISNIADISHTHSNKALLDTYTQTEDNLADAVAKKHEHDNADILNGTTATYTDADSAKLHDIAACAEVNVQSDWKQTDGNQDDYIKNKPSIRDTVSGILTTGGYVTADALDSRHYLTSDSAVITTMQGNISTNKTNIQTNAGTISALTTKEQSDSLLLAGRINALENASMDCNDVKDCIKDTLGKYTPTTELCDVFSSCQISGQSLADLLQGLKSQISDLANQVDEQDSTINAQNDRIDNLNATVQAQEAKINSLARKVDSLSRLIPGGDTTEVPDGQPCPGAPTVSDGTNTYNTVKIGNQCWMAQNLRTDVGDGVYPKKNDGQDDLTPEEQVIYGRLYSWTAMMNDEASSDSVPSGVQGICPTGWHVPSNAEWTVLTDYVKSKSEYQCGGSADNIANALSAAGWTGASNCNAGSDQPTRNKTGFSAVPAGHCFHSYFNGFGDSASFWSATIFVNVAKCRHLGSNGSFVNEQPPCHKDNGFSVRCLRDAGVGGGDTPDTPGGGETAIVDTVTCYSNLGSNDSVKKTVTRGQNFDLSTVSFTHPVETNWEIAGWNTSADGTGTSFTNTLTTSGNLTLYAQWRTFCTVASVNSNSEIGNNNHINTLKDIDNNNYAVVQIGSQCWMKQNLRTSTNIADTGNIYTPTTEQVPGYDVAIYGRMYDWAAVMQGASSSTTAPSGVQGICPTGWHVPSDAEWDTLTDYVHNSTNPNYKCSGCSTTEWSPSTECIAKALASKTGWNTPILPVPACSVGNAPENNDATGFSAVPAGNYDFNRYNDFGDRAFFWSATDNDGTYAVARRLYIDSSNVIRNVDLRVDGFSVRCLRDAGTGGGIIPVPVEVSCEQVMECMGDTLGKLNKKIENLQNTVDSLAKLVHGGDTVKFTCGTSKVKDVDGNEYSTVIIGKQCWMKENLRTDVDGSVYPKKNDGQDGLTPDEQVIYGRLYTWTAMMNGKTSSDTVPSGVQGICPTGWHVPSDAEWTQLTAYVKSQHEYVCEGCSGTDDEWYTYCIAKALSQPTGWSNTGTGCNAGNTGEKSNATGFAAVPAGYCFYGSFNGFGFNANFWSATQDDGGYAWCRTLGSLDSHVASTTDGKVKGFSVRCLRD